VGIVGAGLGVGGLSPMVRAIPPELEGIGARLTGTAVGLVFAVGEIGGFFGPVLIGWLHDLTGSFAPGLAVLAASGVAAVLAGFRLRTGVRGRTSGEDANAGD
jgi:cyanate permease